MANNTVVSFTLRCVDRATRVITSIGGAIGKLAKGIWGLGANLGGWVQSFQAAAGTIQGVFSKLWGAIKESFKFESLTIQFKTLLGSMEDARERMAALAEFAEVTPFNLEEVVKASRTLTVFSDGALGTEYSLRLVGDAAAAVGAGFDEVAFWVGRAYAMIKGGQPFGEAAMRLQELGILTPAVRTEMEALQASGAKNSEVWEAFTARLEEFGGAMEDLSQTGDGLTSTLEDTWTAAVREFGDAFQDAAKESIGFLITLLGKLKADGTIKEWAQAALNALTPVKDLITAILGGGEERSSALKVAWDYLKAVWDYAADVIKASVKYAGQMLVAYAHEAATAFAWSESKEEELMRIANATKKGAYWELKNGLTRASGNLKWTTRDLAKEAAVLAESTRKRVEAEAEALKASPPATKPTAPATEPTASATPEATEAQTKPKETDAQAKKRIKDDLDAAGDKKREELQEKENKLLKDRTYWERQQNNTEKLRTQYAKQLADLDKEILKLKEREADFHARALDSREDKRRREEEKEEKRQKDREKKLNRDAWALLRKHATLSDPYALLRKDFDVSKLGHRGRALREWMIASLLGNDAAKERNFIAGKDSAAVEKLKEIKTVLEDNQKSLDALLRQS